MNEVLNTTVSLQDLEQIFTGNAFHREIQAIPVIPANLINRNRVGMLQLRGNPGLAKKTSAFRFVLGKFVPQSLDRHPPPGSEGGRPEVQCAQLAQHRYLLEFGGGVC